MDDLLAMLKALDIVLLDSDIDDNGKVAYAINALAAIRQKAAALSAKLSRKD
jgi:hypothetical protein